MNMLPMGTIVACCMLAGVLFAARLPVLSSLPRLISIGVGWLVLAAGLWNVFWYGLRHFTEFWGYSALVSGVLMVITGCYILDASRLPGVLQRIRPVVLVVLFGYFLLYAVTIVRL